ncbi:MAG: M23 family metallopeptidase [Chloroflexota bacterium]|nr:M23 family metallopeptidase [Chloroflexota bacterium]
MKKSWLLASIIATISLALVPAGATFGGSGSNPRFLTLPFPETEDMRIQDGWWRGDMDLHRGLDYIRGRVDRPATWQSFPVIAAASGKVCAGSGSEDRTCIHGVGKHVMIRHRKDGRTYYTYYGHLRKIAPEIPVGTDAYETKVKRGQIIGWAGKTGNPGTATHLHFEILTGPGQWLDPYDIYGYAAAYPAPADPRDRACGPDHFWRECPPAPYVPVEDEPPPEGDGPSRVGVGDASTLAIRADAALRLTMGRRRTPRRA